MDTYHMLLFLSHLAASVLNTSKNINLLESAMAVLSRRGGDVSDVAPFLPTLLTLRDMMSESEAWEKVVDIALDGSLPPFFDGMRLAECRGDKTISDLIEESSSRWCISSHRTLIDLGLFLDRTHWTECTASIIVRLTYSQSSQRSVLRDWFRSGEWQARSTRNVVFVLRALLDTHLPSSPFNDDDHVILVALCERILDEVANTFDHDLSQNVVFCVKAIASSHPSVGSKVASFLLGRVKPKNFQSTICSLALHLDPQGNLGNAVVEAGIKWAIDTLSEKFVPSYHLDSLSELRRALLKLQPKAHHAESIVSVVIQGHLNNMEALVFVQTILDRVQFKVNTPSPYERLPTDGISACNSQPLHSKYHSTPEILYFG